MKKFVEDCLMSKNITPPLLCGSITLPRTLNNRDKLLKTEDQGQTSTCAAHSATSWLENIMWRRTGVPKNYDPYKLYSYAKTIDGYPGIDGTTIDAVLKGCIALGWYQGKESDVVCYSDVASLKRLIHKYDIVLAAFNCSELWMKSQTGKIYLNGDPGNSCGGHCVTACGYDDDGLYIQNSWGVNWHKYGFAQISWELVNKQFMYCGIIKNCLNDLG